MGTRTDLVQWVDSLLDVHAGAPGARALLLITAVLTAIGTANFVLYSVRIRLKCFCLRALID